MLLRYALLPTLNDMANLESPLLQESLTVKQAGASW